VNDLHISSLDTSENYVMPNVSLRYPYLSGVRLSVHVVEFQHPSLHRGHTGPIQTFKLKHIRVGFGIRHASICDCQRPVIKLYYLHRKLACKKCHNVVQLSQKLDKHTRPILKAYRLARFLELKANINQRTQERLLRRFGEKAMRPQSNYRTRGPMHWK
jgi:hypothetical protein